MRYKKVYKGRRGAQQGLVLGIREVVMRLGKRSLIARSIFCSNKEGVDK